MRPRPGGGWRGWLERLDRELEAGAAGLERVAGCVLDNARLRPGESVADLGAGTGFLTFRASSRVGEAGTVTAVDSDASCLERLGEAAAARGVRNVTAVHATLDDLPFADGEFDAALCRSALVYSPDIVKAASEMLRVARGARFSVFEPLAAEVAWAGAPGRRFLELEEVLKESGGARSVDRGALRAALEAAGAGPYDSLVVHFEPLMRGRDPRELAREYLYDLPGELAASFLLKERIPEDDINNAVREFARAASRGMVRCSLPCMFAWRASR